MSKALRLAPAVLWGEIVFTLDDKVTRFKIKSITLFVKICHVMSTVAQNENDRIVFCCVGRNYRQDDMQLTETKPSTEIQTITELTPTEPTFTEPTLTELDEQLMLDLTWQVRAFYLTTDAEKLSTGALVRWLRKCGVTATVITLVTKTHTDIRISEIDLSAGVELITGLELNDRSVKISGIPSVSSYHNRAIMIQM